MRRDAKLSRATLAVGLEMLHHEHSRTGLLWLSANTLAKLVSVSTRTVKAARKMLVMLGYFELVELNRGRHRTNRYRPVFRCSVVGERVSASSPFREEPALGAQCEEKVKAGVAIGEVGRAQKVKDASPDYMEDSFKDPLDSEMPTRSAPLLLIVAECESISPATKAKALNRIRENVVELDLEQLEKAFLKARERLRPTGKAIGAIDDGFSAYVTQAIRNRQDADQQAPRRSREEQIRLIRG